ncbi:MAG TPA: class I SAM-dependent methyltransferase [Mycobacteriales bacterium]|nr:class I SAM-dependent methyltransferase [Mycobacteriales bacterium]
MDYSASAEFYDIVSHRHRLGTDPPLAEALAGVDTTRGPVADLGAGTGRSTEVIARTLPDARILAVEPSPGMRAVLTSRVVSDDDLKARVTIVAGTAQEVRRPDRLSAAVICGMVGYLNPTDRATLWRRLADRLRPGAPIVVELMAISSPQVVPSMCIARDLIGDHLYEAWMSGEPLGPDRMRWRARWQVSERGTIIRECHMEHEWYTFGIDQIAVEAGMTGRRITSELGVLVR